MERNAYNKEFDRLQSLAKERKEDKNVHLCDFREFISVLVNEWIQRLVSLLTIDFIYFLFHFLDLIVEPDAIKGLLFGIVFGWLIQFPGGITFLNYAVIIFERSGASKIDPNVSSIMLALAQLIGCFVSTKLADSLGRKMLLNISFIGSATGLFIFALYLHLVQIGYDLSAYTWVPVASLSFIMFIASAGVYALFSVCFVEYLPSKVWIIRFIITQR